jgi:hypothetical protein
MVTGTGVVGVVGGVDGIDGADVADAAGVTGTDTGAVAGAVTGAVTAGNGSAAAVVGLALIGVPAGCVVCAAAGWVEAARSAAVCEPQAASRTPSAQAAPIAAVVLIVVVR